MSIASALGFGRKIRYAVVGAGDIAQSAFMPGVAHTGNSELVAVVTGDADKASELKKTYDLAATYTYEQFADLLASKTIDAIYLATPNWRHAEFAVPALEAGVSVLCEKPVEVSKAQAERIAAAAKSAPNGAKLMVAYRLHFEPATLKVIAQIRDGQIGEPVSFVSSFGQVLDPSNHRADHGIEAGPLFDMAPYPINAIRYLFGAEPVEVVSAVGTRHPDAGLGDLDDTVAVTLRMPGGQLAQFTVSYVSEGEDMFVVSGTKASLHLSSAYGFGTGKTLSRYADGKTESEDIDATDQFGGELAYFSDCLLEGRDPEPDIEEGMADLRVIEGIVAALKSGQPQKLPPFERTRRIDVDAQKRTLKPVAKKPKEVGAKPPAED